MSSLRTSPPHRCQIDCSNHDEVIYSLQHKSKELFYFWRNYQWLYTRYMNQLHQQPKETIIVQNNHEIYQKQISRLQIQNQMLKKQNKNLQMSLILSKRQAQNLQINKYESEYKSNINSLSLRIYELQSIIERQLKEISHLNSLLKNIENEFQGERNNFNLQIRKNRQTIIQLQKSIDEMRMKIKPAQPQGISSNELQELKYKQTTMISNRFALLQQQLQRMMSNQCFSMQGQFEQRFQSLILQLTQQQLQSILLQVNQS